MYVRPLYQVRMALVHAAQRLRRCGLAKVSIRQVASDAMPDAQVSRSTAIRAEDTIQIAASLGVTDFAGILARARVVRGGDDVLITFSPGNTLRLEDVQMSAITASDFVFA